MPPREYKRIIYREYIERELLSFFLDPNEKHGLGASFYNGFISSLNATEKYADFDFGQFLELSTQQTTDKGNRIDLWFETDTALVVVEVKVHHHQNNPFPDYVSWGKKRLKEINQSIKKEEYPVEKKLVTLVLCPQGECYADHWVGLAYNDLTSEIRIALAHDIFKNPLNKWGVFARDFLLHLDSFVDLLETNMESLNFVVDHMQQIQELVKLREGVYQEIIDHINNEFIDAFHTVFDYPLRSDEKIWIHTNDLFGATCNEPCCGTEPCPDKKNNKYFGVPYLPSWKPEYIALFNAIGTPQDACDTPLKTITTTSGNWIVTKALSVQDGGHTDGTINLKNYEKKMVIAGTKSRFQCPYPEDWQFMSVHGNISGATVGDE